MKIKKHILKIKEYLTQFSYLEYIVEYHIMYYTGFAGYTYTLKRVRI